MGEDALSALDSPCSRASAATVTLSDDGLRLGGIVLAKADAFDEERLAALLAAAYGDALPHSALAYVKGALAKQREGQTALAQTYLALAGLPPLADPFEAIRRLSAADGLMKSGVAPAAIIEALAPSSNAVERAYNPDQPRVPAGNGRISGQWTSEDEAASDRGSVEPSPVDARTQSKKPIQTADNSSDWAQYLDPIGPADAAQYNGAAPNAQHQAGVDQAIAQYQALGYGLYSDQPVAVEIPGFDTPRIYDFVVRDPDTGNLIGVEVKTTLGDTIFLNPFQVAKDVALIANQGATARATGDQILGVSYATYCGLCDEVDIRPKILYAALEFAKIPFIYGHLPGQQLR